MLQRSVLRDVAVFGGAVFIVARISDAPLTFRTVAALVTLFAIIQGGSFVFWRYVDARARRSVASVRWRWLAESLVMVLLSVVVTIAVVALSNWVQVPPVQR
jgi:hypothetical protein